MNKFNNILHLCIMAGIYIHIPFCKKACNYCNFHFSTSLKQEEAMINAIIQELDMRFGYLESQKVTTIYWGGGTPSILQKQSILKLHQHISKYVLASDLKEYTIECNPDDISGEFLDTLKSIGVTRLSLGIQSFKEQDLKYMNRAHTSAQVFEAIQLISQYNFDLSIDLIYGIPELLDQEWHENILLAMHPSINHISAYALTVEPKTALAHQINKGESTPIDENQAARQFEILVTTLAANGYEQYEISNFARHKKYALHNTNYWKGDWYLGLGPSAHSFNGISRAWNVANNNLYIQLINKEIAAFEEEILSVENQWNEYIMTALRTMWGIDMNVLNSQFDASFVKQFEKGIHKYILSNDVNQNGQVYTLTLKGKLFADAIASDLFV